jgi:amino acid adenylation domain-containing protein/non-ribosomal peptide synthase protein (TIGR01720 family)
MTDLRSRLAALPPDRRELLEQRLAALLAARGPAHRERIAPRDRSRPTPLGIAQQREWAVERVRGANNIAGVFRVEGDLDADLVSTVLTDVVRRHEVLRSTFDVGPDGVPVQVVHPVTQVPVPVIDLTHLDAEQQKREVRRQFAGQVTGNFPPGEPVRLRLVLLRLAEQTHVALFCTDHTASDGWSMAILVREIAALYQLHRNGGAPLREPEIQFGDFAAWQREHVDEDLIAAEVRHWERTLAGIRSGHTLPTDRPYPARPRFTGAAHRVELSPELSDAVRRLGDREGASLVMVLLATAAILLRHWLDDDDIVIGSLVAGRNRVEVEQLVGCFANPLPLRMRISVEQTLRSVVRQARDTMATALDHQDVPFDRLIEALGLGREAGQTSLARLWINALTGPDMTLKLPDLHFTPEPVELGMASVDLTLAAVPGPDRLYLEWQYMTELFDPDTVALLAEQFRGVLARLVAAPDSTVAEVELTEAVGGQVGPPSAAMSRDPGFLELFRQRVATAPHAPAVVCDRAVTTYAELARDADRLAHRLRRLGVRAGTPVGVLVDRSPRLAVAILGVLAAGGVYVPLDPSYPADRIGFILSDAGTKVLVADGEPARRLREAGAVLPEHVIVADADEPATDQAYPALPEPHPDSLAYVVYTSGSTGEPKGVGITHRSLVTFARDVADRLGLGAADRFLQFASPSFDVLVEELFPIWLAGGAVATSTDHIVTGQVDLVELIERERVTVIELPTAYWHEWVRELERLDRSLPSHLRLVIIGGERVLPERLTMWRRHGIPVMHVYGLTEATCSSTFFRLDPADPVRDWPNLPIGTALPSADLRVLNSRLARTPLGGTGELYIGGVSLARGYVGRPGLTADRFVADPDPAHPGERLYRTGDLVRRRADGNLEFISRVDTQIHIRGFRVEPAEIESALSRHPDVAESIVDLYEPAAADRRLVAYVVPRPGAQVRVRELRPFLESRLPPYMVPSAFVELEALPLSANGKVDRGRLPAPLEDRGGTDEGFVAPRSPAEQALAEIVASIVGVSRVGVQDDFFEVGGDSILAIQVVARAQEAGLQLTAYDLFAHPTVEGLAEVAGAAVRVDAEQGEVTGPVFLAPTQWWFSQASPADRHHWNTSVLVRLHVPVDAAVVATGVERLLAHHDGLRQRFLLSAANSRARIAPVGDSVPFEEHDLSGLDEAVQDGRLVELLDRIQSSLDPAVGPLLRVALVRFAPRPDRLAVVAHRLVADPPSMRLILEYLETAVVQLSAGEELRTLPKTTSWQSWCRRLNTFATSDAVQAEREYWAQVVDAAAGALPYDLPTGPDYGVEATTRTLTVSLDRPETDILVRTGTAASGTAPAGADDGVAKVLLAALARTLSPWSGAVRHVIDLERHDRESLFEDVDLARTVGWFSRTHPIALTCEPGATPGATLEVVAEQLRSVPHAGIGWQLLRQTGDLAQPSPAGLAFTYLGAEFRPVTGTFSVLDRPVGRDRSPNARRPYAIEVVSAVTGGRLVVHWRYSETLHREETVRALAEGHLAELRALTGRDAPAPSDFPLARLDQAQLSRLLDSL